MLKWFLRLLVLGAFGFGGYVAYDYYRAGLHTRPRMPEGAFSLSFKSGLKAIMVELPDARSTRRYLGYPFEVPFYLEEAWSFCTSPTEEDSAAFKREHPDRPGERLEANCSVEVDGENVKRGFVVTVPKF